MTEFELRFSRVYHGIYRTLVHGKYVHGKYLQYIQLRTIWQKVLARDILVYFNCIAALDYLDFTPSNVTKTKRWNYICVLNCSALLKAIDKGKTNIYANMLISICLSSIIYIYPSIYCLSTPNEIKQII